MIKSIKNFFIALGPALMVPTILAAITGALVFNTSAPLIGFILGLQWPDESFNAAGFITTMGASVTVWVHFFVRRKIWKNSQKEVAREKANLPYHPDAEFDKTNLSARIRREVAYLLDYLHIVRALNDKKCDKIIEAEKLSDKARSPELIPFETTIQDVITTAQEEEKAVNFLKESYPNHPLVHHKFSQEGTANNPLRIKSENIPKNPHLSDKEKHIMEIKALQKISEFGSSLRQYGQDRE